MNAKAFKDVEPGERFTSIDKTEKGYMKIFSYSVYNGGASWVAVDDSGWLYDDLDFPPDKIVYI